MVRSAIQRASTVLPATVYASTLWQSGGLMVLSDMVSAERTQALLQEASAALHEGTESRVSAVDSEEYRGGSPARRFVSAPGGREQMCFYQCANTIKQLSALCGTAVRPTGKCGTYSYYRPGDHLSLHRDIVTCDLSVITCLLDRHHPASQGGMSCFYPHRQAETLSQIRETPKVGAIRQRLAVGSTLVFLGGLIPHLIETLGPSDFRIVSILCFELTDGELSDYAECDCGCG